MTPEPLREALRPDKKFHRKLLSYVRARARDSASRVTERVPAWNSVERTLRFYVDPDELNSRGDLKNPSAVFPQVVVPESAAIRDSILTYIWLGFVSNNPFTPIAGRGPEDVWPAQLMAKVSDYHHAYTRSKLLLYAWLADAIDFGLGVVKTRWVTDTVSRWTSVDGVLQRQRPTIYQGPRSSLVDIFRFFHDVHFPVGEFQRGEHTMWTYDLAHVDFKKRAIDDGWINYEDKKERKAPFGRDDVFLIDPRDLTERNRAMNTSDPMDSIVTRGQWDGETEKKKPTQRPHRMLEAFLRIIPKDWAKWAEEAGCPTSPWFDSEYPEIWLVTVCDGETIVDFSPTSLTDFPFDVCESSPDLKSCYNQGVLEALDGAQDLLNWFLNSHVANVQAGLSNSFVVDPEAVDIDSVNATTPAKRIVLRQEAWGRDVRSCIQQIPWQDYTRSHLENIPMLSDMMRRQAGATDNLQGISGSGRRSATEMSAVNRSAASRIEKMRMLMSIQGVGPWFARWVRLIQETMTVEQWVEVTGEEENAIVAAQKAGIGASKKVEFAGERGSRRALVTPDVVQSEFDYPVQDGSMSPDSPAMAQAWSQALQTISSSPEFMAEINPLFFLKGLLRCLGLRNIQDAEIKRLPPGMGAPGQPPVVPDEEIARAQEKGSAVPVSPEALAAVARRALAGGGRA